MLRTLRNVTIAIMLVALTFSAAMAATSTTANVQIILDGGELSIAKAQAFQFNNVLIADVVAQPGGLLTKYADGVPDFTLLDARGLSGDGSGWHVNFNCAKLLNQTDNSYTLDLGYAQGSTTLALDNGQAIDGTYGPLMESVSATDMNADTMVINTSQGYGKGQYSFDLHVDDFAIPINAATARAGTYQGLFTATIVAGPGGTGGWTGNVQ